jgi:hypothetical protein
MRPTQGTWVLDCSDSGTNDVCTIVVGYRTGTARRSRLSGAEWLDNYTATFLHPILWSTRGTPSDRYSARAWVGRTSQRARTRVAFQSSRLRAAWAWRTCFRSAGVRLSDSTWAGSPTARRRFASKSVNFVRFARISEIALLASPTVHAASAARIASCCRVCASSALRSSSAVLIGSWGSKHERCKHRIIEHA